MSGNCDTCGNHTLDCQCHMVYKREWGFHNLMVLAAFRYCLGRQSYIVGSCVSWLIDFWLEIDPNTKNIIVRETQECLDKGHAGDKCDIDNWKKLLEYAAKKKQKGHCTPSTS